VSVGEVVLKSFQPIALNERSVNINESMKIIGEKGGGYFIAGSVVYNLSRSRYGKRLVQSNTRDYGNARWLGKASGKFGGTFSTASLIPFQSRSVRKGDPAEQDQGSSGPA
jgi:hypothetical protein